MPNLIKDRLTSQTFKKTGKSYTSSAGIISIYKRKEYSRIKPELYAYYEPPGEPRFYLSSLYPQPDGSFIAERNRVYWHITLTDQEILFQRTKTKTPYVYQ